MGDLVSRHSAKKAAVIGDIHGHSERLGELLARIEPERSVVVVGDLCDRGPDTRGVIESLLRRGAVGAMGNHDEVFLRFLDGELDPTWLEPHMGGAATLASYGIASSTDRERVPTSHRAFLRSLVVALDLEVDGARYWVVHAGLPTGHSLRGVPFADIVPHLARHHRQGMLWGRNDPEAALPVGRPVIMGHTRRSRPLLGEDAIAIDTGCGSGGPLTALLLPERAFVSVG